MDVYICGKLLMYSFVNDIKTVSSFTKIDAQHITEAYTTYTAFK